jgi:hypothetical protein
MWNRLRSSSDAGVDTDTAEDVEVDDSKYKPKFAKKDENPVHYAFASALSNESKASIDAAGEVEKMLKKN